MRLTNKNCNSSLIFLTYKKCFSVSGVRKHQGKGLGDT